MRNCREHGRGRERRYSVWDNRTDFPVVIGGTAAECARAMKLTLASFYCAVTRATNGENRRWTILRDGEEEDDG